MTEDPTPELVEFHDAHLSELIRSPEQVDLSFTRMRGFFATGDAEVFDVRTCRATLTFREVSESSVRISGGMPLQVADGQLTVDGTVVYLRGSRTWTGVCALKLETDRGVIEVRAGVAEWDLDDVGDVFEQWKGPL